MHTDQWGHEVTAASAEAVEALERTWMSYLGLRLETGDLLGEAFEADPEMPMASLTRGNFLQLFSFRAFEGKIDQAIAGAEAAIGKHGGTAREKLHLEALKAWRAGQLRRTLEIWEQILLDNPRDVLALRLAHFLHFYLGDSQNLRDSVLRVMHAWDETVPGFGFVLGLKSFGLEESGNYAPAEVAGKHAVEINAEDAWATHAVAHVMEMQGRHRDGIEWLEGLSGNWGPVNNFRFHTWWHLGLYYLETENFDKVLELYDTEIRAESTDDHIDLANAAAMLARLEMRGVDIGDRWAELGEVCARHMDDHMFSFHDAHYIMAMAGAGRPADVEQSLKSMAAAAEADTTEGLIFKQVGLPLCRAMVAFRNGEYGKVVELMAPVRYQVFRIGGSHAQRDLFAQMLAYAAVRDGRFDLARALMSERVERRPGSSTNWRWYADVLDGVGDGEGAAAARARAAEALAA
ncbi:MAG: tetratricopeptide repeat protein [Alphaproteobacteria bacterium]|jgi:tetratricopeptide (TPR) repeat protein|nr:tetratricopeptide repeat protein [Alphaproteobacteria bacterium]